jgi:hypothetical protein
MKTKHTPGKWKITSYGDIISGETNICTINNSMLNSQFEHVSIEATANAKIIEAAPGMLEALQHIEKVVFPANGIVTEFPEAYKILKNAIKKATE